MAIPEVSQQSYEFQDAACVWIMLRFADIAESALLVEPPGGEDAELFVRTRDLRFEIQVKHSQDPVTLDTLASWLAHAPPGDIKPTLLERLLDEPQRSALFFASGRCTDAVRKHLPKEDWRDWKGKPAQGRFTLGDAKSLACEYAQAKLSTGAGTPMTNKRKARNAALLDRRTVTEIKGCLSRVVILEEIGLARLRSDCAAALVESHLVPRHLAPEIVRGLEELVKRAKVHKQDAYPDLREAIRKARSNYLLPSVSVSRGLEDDLSQRLEAEGVLLLSGAPRCGKSHMALRVADRFQRQGYEIRDCGDRIEEASRLLRNLNSPERVVILDDPLGGAHSTPDPGDTLNRLSALVGFAKPGRRLLIVAQSMDFLLEASGRIDLAACEHRKHRWIDLSSPPREFVEQCWKAHAESADVSPDLGAWVADEIQTGRLVLSPGQIEYLAANAEDVEPRTVETVERVAKGDATSLGLALRDQGFRDDVVCLALATAPGKPIALPEFAFVCGAGGSHLPTYFPSPHPEDDSEEHARGHTMPAYTKVPLLSDEQQKRLMKLERRRILSVDGELASAQFSHAFFRAASESLLDVSSRIDVDRWLDAVRRGLFSLSPATCLATASNLEWVYVRMALDDRAAKALFEIGLEGIYSRFLGVRDHCLQFVLRHSEHLTKGNRDFQKLIASSTHVLPQELEWQDGYARLPASFYKPSEAVFESIALAYKGGRTEIELPPEIIEAPMASAFNAEAVANSFGFLDQYPERLTPARAAKLFDLDEAFIRAEAYRVWLSIPRVDERDTLARMLADDHPTSGFALLVAAATGWRNWDDTRRKIVGDGLAKMARSIGAACPMASILTAFDQRAFGGDEPPWSLFASLLPIVLDTMPPEAYVNEEGLDRCARAACKALGPEGAAAVCDILIHRLEVRLEVAFERRLGFQVPPVGHVFGIAGLAVDATSTDPRWRDGMLRRLLAIKPTAAAARFVADLVDRWDDLTTEERDLLLERISRRFDRRWLKAVSITRERVPAEIENLILGRIRLADGSQAVEDAPEDEGIADALMVHWRRHPAIAHLGLRARGRGGVEVHPWDSITRDVAADPAHRMFSEAFAFLANVRPRDVLIEAIERAGGGRPFLRPLIAAAVVNGSQKHSRAWSALLGSADGPTRMEWLAEAARYAPAILRHGPRCDQWLLDANDREEMGRHLRSDIIAIRLAELLVAPEKANRLPHLFGSKAQERALRGITELLETAPPRL